MPVCTNCGNANPEEAKFCSACGAAVPVAARVSKEVRKTVTVVLTDVVGSTTIGEQSDPESLRRVMTRFYEEMKQALELHGGTVRELIGDSVMGVFGTPVAHEDDAFRAVRAASEMSERLARLNEELERDWGVQLRVRTGVNTGEVVAGGPDESQTLVLGDAVNVAARFEQAAEPGQILLGESTYRLVRDGVRAETVPPLALKGKTEPVPAWKLVSVTPLPVASRRRLDSPIVGREKELALLRQTFECTVTESTCELATVLGPAGVGKSRLTREFLGGLADRATVLRGRCLPYGEGITFFPMGEIVGAAAAIGDTDSPEAAYAKIAALLRDVEDSDPIARRVAAAIGLAEEGVELQEIFWALRKLLESLAQKRPLVCVFDDIHWGEDAFLDLLEHLAGWTREVPLLVLCLARPELLEARPSWPTANTIVLDSLSEDESGRLIANLLGHGELADEVSARVRAAAEGNPLYVEELLRMLVDDGLLERQNGSWRATRDLSELAIPPTIHALLAARLDRLEEGERGSIQRASVVGKVFWWGAVAELSPGRTGSEVGADLQTLVRKELIRPDPTTFAAEDGFRFGHILIRDAAYTSIPKAARSALHELFAAWLERKAGERASEYEEIIGYHLEQAFRYGSEFGPLDREGPELAARAASRLASAGTRAHAREDMSAAANLLGRAANLLPNSPERLALLPKLADALVETGKLEHAQAVFSETAELAAARGEKGIELLARLELLALATYTGAEANQAAIAELAERAIAVLEPTEDDAALARAWELLSDVHAIACVWSERATALERALIHAQRAGEERQEALLLAYLAVSMYLGSTPAPEGIQRCEEILAGNKGRGPMREGVALIPLAGFHAMQGRFDEARRNYRGAQALYTELGLTLRVATRTMVGGKIEERAGDLEAAERELRFGLETLEAMGEQNILSTVAGMLARVMYAQGRDDEAERLAELCGRAAASDDVISQVLARSARATVLARRGEIVEAERLAREAVSLIEQTDQLDSHGDALLDLTEVLRLAGRDAEAAQVAEQAAGLYERKGNIVSAAKARASIEEMTRETSSR